MSDMSSIVTNPLLVLLGLFLLTRIVMGQLKEKTRKVSSMWIMPALMLYISYAAVEQGLLTNEYALLLLLPAVVLGAIIGLVRGTRVKVRLGEKSGTLMVKGSILSLVIWGTMIVIRFGARYALGDMFSGTIASACVTALIVMSLTNTIVYYGYLYFRYFTLTEWEGVKDIDIL